MNENENIKNIKKTTFYQGKLARWGLAWTFFTKEELEKYLYSIENKKVANENFSNFSNTSELVSRLRFTHTKTKFKNNDKKPYKEI